MPKLISIEERKPECHCWFCGTNKSVKYTGQILNPCPQSDTSYLDILICNKCALIHEKNLVD